MKNKIKRDFKLTSKVVTATWTCIILGILLLSVCTVMNILEVQNSDIITIAFVVAYMAATALTFVISRMEVAHRKANTVETAAISTVMAEIVKRINIPFVITDSDGKIIWYNDQVHDTFNKHTPLFGLNIEGFCHIIPEELAKSIKISQSCSFSQDNLPDFSDESTQGAIVELFGKTYVVRSYELIIAEKNYFITVFSDNTGYYTAKSQLDKKTTVVAYAVIDNIEELAQYVRVSSHETASEAEAVIKNWADSLNALVREYDRDKYVLVFDKEKLSECVENKFDVLEQIRNITIGDSGMPVTMSMGISYIGDSIAERERNAKSALDNALQRGGDQVVVRGENGLEFFGGRTKRIQKRTKVMARVVANQLLSQIATSENVVIMGHKNPDFDSIGACIGIARLCLHCGVPSKIIVSKNNSSFKNCTEKLLNTDIYKDIFVDPSYTSTSSLIHQNTLVIVVDANNISILEEPSVISSAQRLAIIDHHRKSGDVPERTVMNYIDPSASSTCELVSELLEQCLPPKTMLKEEATIMLSGIMVDTKNFTKSTGTRTFSAALYLRGEGGNSEVANTFFNEDFDEYSAEAKFGSNVTVYRDTIAITTSSGSKNGNDRVAASKAADKLLSVKNVEASFALVTIGDTVHISARSNGKINVQLILEDLNGGGHFDAAGAQVVGKSINDVMIKLKESIDKYLDNL